MLREWKTRVASVVLPTGRLWTRYLPIPIGQQLLFDHLPWRPREFTCPTRFGFRFRGRDNEFVCRHVYLFGWWEPHVSRWLASTLRPGDVFVDVGAHFGFHTLLASRAVGLGGAVVALEPNPTSHARLLENLAINGSPNVRVVRAAASHRRGAVRLHQASPLNEGMTSLLEPECGGGVSIEVPAAPLPELLSPAELQRARVIKVDVEGAEGLVVEGLLPAASQLRPDVELLLEVTPGCLARLGSSADALIAALAEHGFHPYRIENSYRIEPEYVGGPALRPRRLRGTAQIGEQADLVFSHTDAERL